MRKFIFCISLCVLYSSMAQVTKLTLDQCIESALEKNITLQRSENNLVASRSDRFQARMNFLPDLNGSINYGITEGSGFDTNSGQFVTSTTRNSAPQLNSGVVLFNAFANHHLLSRRSHEYNSSLYLLEDTKIRVKAIVLRNYLAVLLDLENLKITTQRLDFLQEQLTREEKRASVGVGNLETVYNFRSQVANEKLSKVNQENTYRSDVLTLLQSIQLNTETNFGEVELEPIAIQEDDILLVSDPYTTILSDILVSSFQIKSAEESSVSSEAFLGFARAARYPTLRASAGIGSNYSSNNEAQFGGFADQIQNLNYSFLGFRLSIPIFNQFQAKNNIDNAKVQLLNAELNTQQAFQDVTNAAQSDYLDLISAQTAYQSALENYEALDQTFQFIKKRFETGNTDFFSYLESLNNKNRAEAELVSARYSIVFRKRILDLFRNASLISE